MTAPSPVRIARAPAARLSAEPPHVWHDYAVDVRGEALPTGHFLPEEAPDLVIAALREFLD